MVVKVMMMGLMFVLFDFMSSESEGCGTIIGLSFKTADVLQQS